MHLTPSLMALFLGSLVGCDGPFDSWREAADLWEQGRQLVEAGRPEQAIEVFDQALVLDPRSSALLAWRARAEADAGNLARAVETLDVAVASGASDPIILYNRAAYQVRMGDPDAALDDLAIILDGRPELLQSALEDPDLQSLRGSPLFLRLSAPRLDVGVVGEAGSVLRGETFQLEFVLRGDTDLLLDLSSTAEAQPLRLLRVIDDVVSESPGERHLRYTLRVTGGGEGELGPWSVLAWVPGREEPAEALRGRLRAGGGELAPQALALSVDAVPFQLLDLGNQPAEAPSMPYYPVPRTFLRGIQPPWAGQIGGRLVVVAGVGERVEVAEDQLQPPPVQLEIRQGGQAVAVALVWQWRGGATTCHCRVLRAGSVILDEQVAREIR